LDEAKYENYRQAELYGVELQLLAWPKSENPDDNKVYA
jgi:hypothetical protein